MEKKRREVEAKQKKMEEIAQKRAEMMQRKREEQRRWSSSVSSAAALSGRSGNMDWLVADSRMICKKSERKQKVVGFVFLGEIFISVALVKEIIFVFFVLMQQKFAENFGEFVLFVK